MNNSSGLNNEVEAVFIAEGANPVPTQQLIATSQDRTIKPFTLEGLNSANVPGVACGLMSQQPSLMSGEKGLGADIGADP